MVDTMSGELLRQYRGYLAQANGTVVSANVDLDGRTQKTCSLLPKFLRTPLSLHQPQSLLKRELAMMTHAASLLGKRLDVVQR